MKNITINTKSVKVVFNTSSKDFTATMSKFYLALSELNDKRLVYVQNVRSAKSCLATLENNNSDGSKSEKIEAQKLEIVTMEEKHANLVKEIEARLKECYALIPSSLYENYVNGNYDKGVEEFFKAQNINLTPSLTKFMVETVGYKCASAKVMFRKGVTLDYIGKNQFNKLFMSTLAQLMLDKNALKLDAYKWVYVEETK